MRLSYLFNCCPLAVSLSSHPLAVCPKLLFYKKYSKDVSREFDEFQVNTHICKLRCWYVLVIHYMGEFLLGGVLLIVHYNDKCWYFYFR